MSVVILTVDEVMRTLSNDGQYPFVVNDKTVDIVRFALNTGFTDVALDEYSALRVMYQRPGESEVRAQTLTYYDTDGLRNYYDWQLLSADLAEKGTITCALCILRTDGDVEEWHTTPYQIRVLGSIHTDDSDEADESITPTVAQRVAVLESMIQRVASGAPIVVASTSAMTDTAQIYVLSTDGNWYYHNGATWVAGGEYGTVATDTTLTQSGIPADAKAVGDALVSGGGGSGITDQEKALILSLFRNAAYNSDVSVIYATLYDLWNDSPEPTPSGLLHSWDLTRSLVDTVGGAVATLGGNNTSPTQGGDGVSFTANAQYLCFNGIYATGRTYELDIVSPPTTETLTSRIFCADYDNNTARYAAGVVHGRPTGTAEDITWRVYTGAAWDDALENVGEAPNQGYFENRTLKVQVSTDHKWTVKSRPLSGGAWVTHAVSRSVVPGNGKYGQEGYTFNVQVGSNTASDVSTGLKVSGFRVYSGEV